MTLPWRAVSEIRAPPVSPQSPHTKTRRVSGIHPLIHRQPGSDDPVLFRDCNYEERRLSLSIISLGGYRFRSPGHWTTVIASLLYLGSLQHVDYIIDRPPGI